MTSPRVSVIIPAYNVAPYIEDAVMSALGQSYQDLEVIVVNDGSTDATSQILDGIRGDIHRIDQANKGLASAKNAGLRQARGAFIAFLDGDDLWSPGLVQRGVEALDSHEETDIVVFDASLIDETGSPSGSTYYGSRPRSLRFRSQDQPRWIVQYNYILGFNMCRAEILQEHGGFDESLTSFEDWDLWIRAILSGAIVKLVPEALGRYRIRSKSLTTDLQQLAEDESRLLYKASQDPAKPPGTTGRLDYARAKQALLRNDMKLARELFFKAARSRGLHSRFRARCILGAASPALAARLWKA